MHPSMPIKDINFEEMESKNWEYVMLDTIQFNDNQNDEEVIFFFFKELEEKKKS